MKESPGNRPFYVAMFCYGVFLLLVILIWNVLEPGAFQVSLTILLVVGMTPLGVHLYRHRKN